MEFGSVRVFSKYLNCSTLSKDLLRHFMFVFCTLQYDARVKKYLNRVGNSQDLLKCLRCFIIQVKKKLIGVS